MYTSMTQLFLRSAVAIVCTTTVYGLLVVCSREMYYTYQYPRADDTSKTSRPSNMTPVQHVYYLKTHKTGSTSIYSILAEYCRSHDLLPLLPVDIHINTRLPFSPKQVMLHPNTSKYDMVFNHHVYDHRIFQYLHNDTFRFTTVREPFSHFVSSFHYFRDMEKIKYLRLINTSNPVGTFLADPQKFEVSGYESFTNNRQSVDLGYNLSHSFNDLPYIKSFIALTETRFHLVLITDYFHQSLVLLKRALHWSTTDILYYRKLTNKVSMRPSSKLLDLYKRQHHNFSTADTELYKHFLPVFKHRISKERDLTGEVQEFESVLSLVYSFCAKRQSKENHLLIPSGRWSDQIDIDHSKCKWLKLKEIAFTRHLQRLRKHTFPATH